MNIFILDRDPVTAAEYYCDKHVIKIILEIKQMLDHAHGIRSGYYNHPLSKWVRRYTGNYKWTTKHAVALCHEYTRRYGRIHAFEPKILEYHDNIPTNIWEFKIISFYQGVASDCKKEDVVEAYREYYIRYKRDIAKWKLGNVPHWWK